MLPKLVHYSAYWNRGLYVAIANNAVRYLCIVRHPSGHLCGYVNVNKDTWNVVADRVREQLDITYEGIGSDILSVPSAIVNNVPTDVEAFWVGIDYNRRGVNQPTEEELLDRLFNIMQVVTAEPVHVD